MKLIKAFPESMGGRAKSLSEEPTIHPSCRIVNSQVGAWTDLMANTTLEERFSELLDLETFLKRYAPQPTANGKGSIS